MDEGAERTRLHLRPNRDFYDTYEVVAPACSSSFAQASTAAGTGTKASRKVVSPSGLSSSPPPANASPTTAEASAAASPGGATAAAAAAAATTVEIGAGDAGLPVAAAAGGAVVPAEEATGGSAEAVTAMTTATAVTAAASDSATANSDDSLSMALPTTNREGGATNAAAEGDREGGQVAAIAALVKTMSESVGVGGKGGARKKQPLKSVFDLDDTDCSALLELEELQMENATPDGGDDVSSVQGVTRRGAIQRACWLQKYARSTCRV